MSSTNCKELQKLIVLNYIENNCSFYIPNDLQNLCFKFFNVIETLEIPKNHLEIISSGDLNKINQLKTKSKTYSINNIIFELFICNQQDIWLQLKPKKLPKNIEYIRTLVKVWCKEIDIKYIQTLKFEQNNNFHYIFSLFPIYPQNTYFYKLNQLTISFIIDLIAIKYKNKSEISPSKSFGSVMKTQSNYKFKLTKKMLQNFHYGILPIGSINNICNDSFDDNWLITLSNGKITTNNDNFCDVIALRLTLLVLPAGIGSVRANYSVKCVNNDNARTNCQNSRTFNYGNIHFGFYHHNDCFIPIKYINSTLFFEIDVKIIEVKDCDDKIIDKSKWSTFGIV